MGRYFYGNLNEFGGMVTSHCSRLNLIELMADSAKAGDLILKSTSRLVAKHKLRIQFRTMTAELAPECVLRPESLSVPSLMPRLPPLELRACAHACCTHMNLALYCGLWTRTSACALHGF